MAVIPNLHDWLLYSVELGDRKATIGFRAPEGKELRFLVAEGVEDFVCNDLREGNTVLSVDSGIEHAADDVLRRILYLKPDDNGPELARLRDQIKTGALQFVRVMPSYGADLALVARSISILEKPASLD